MTEVLPEGLYETPVTRALMLRLEATRRAGLSPTLEDFEKVEHNLLVARYVAAELLRGLESLPSADRERRQIELCNELLGRIGGHDQAALDDSRKVLLSVHRGASPPVRPSTPIALSGLLTGARDEPQFGNDLEAEIASADRIDALVSFVTWEGWRRLQDAFQVFARAGKRLRLLTTTYTGATEADAVEALAQLPGSSVRVSYDSRRTRLHAKAWLFHRESGFSTAYIGSANLSRAALSGGLEWTVKIGQADLSYVLDKFRGTFETLWASPEFVAFDPGSEADRQQLRDALASESGRSRNARATPFLLVSLQPYPYQEMLLERLEAERSVHGRTRNLVVAATGTGKTMLAAFDYRGLAGNSGLRPRLLFVAHREELLQQARLAYRHVLRDEAFGEVLGGGNEPRSFEHLFTTVQSFRSRGLTARMGADYWPIVVVDECHHATADTYTEIVERLKPKILLGLTATPERADGKSILPYFDGRPATEIRLWDALDQQLLAPFEYYGLADGTDLSQVRWSRSGDYDAAELDRVYTGNDRRAELVLEQFRRWRGRVNEARALGFCVSVRHAEFMARKFSEAGIPALAVHGDSRDEVRREAPRKLERREVNVLFTCDLYNEGIDLPFVESLLLLRPTSSPTVFLQQLGRGLRLHEGKTTCLVLDFIGQSREGFRFDRILTAITGIPRGQLREAVAQGFPTLPSGCHLKLDPVAREIVLADLRAVLSGGKQRLARELKAAADRRGGSVTLAQFLEDSGRPLEDVYDAGGLTALRRLAGLLPANAPPGEAELEKRFEHLVHIDDPARLDLYERLAAGTLDVAALGLADHRRLLMLGYQLHRERSRLFTPAEVCSVFEDQVDLRRELAELVYVLRENVTLAPSGGALPSDWALALHRRYSRREAQTAVGDWNETSKPESREGVRRVGADVELLFVTLVKEERHFSPTTRYRDYAISRELFHWQSQSGASAESEAGRRYLEQASNGQRFLLFVRSHKGEEFRFLGPVRYVTHEGRRPLSITWRLDSAMPAALFFEYGTLVAA